MSSNKRNIKLGRVGERPLWALHLSNVTRAVHQVGGAVFLTCFLFQDTFSLPLFYLLLSGVSGVILFGFEGLRHRQIFRELTGLVTFFKMILLGLAYHGIGSPQVLVLSAFIIASLASHSPKNMRHRLLL